MILGEVSRQIDFRDEEKLKKASVRLANHILNESNDSKAIEFAMEVIRVTQEIEKRRIGRQK